MEKDDQMNLFNLENSFEKEWNGMPEFVQEDLQPKRSIIVNFETPEDVDAFAKLMDQTITAATVSLWYPKAEIARFADKRWIEKAGVINEEKQKEQPS